MTTAQFWWVITPGSTCAHLAGRIRLWFWPLETAMGPSMEEGSTSPSAVTPLFVAIGSSLPSMVCLVLSPISRHYLLSNTGVECEVTNRACRPRTTWPVSEYLFFCQSFQNDMSDKLQSLYSSLNVLKRCITAMALKYPVTLTSSSNDVNVDKIRDLKKKKKKCCRVCAVRLRRHLKRV